MHWIVRTYCTTFHETVPGKYLYIVPVNRQAPMETKKLFLLDGHALVYRAHYAFIARPLFNSKGINTSAINGFTRTLWDIISKEKPSHLAVAFDPHGPVFRNEVYPEYKANRDAQPEDIGIALPIIRKIVEAFRIPILEVPGFEADDAIGTIAKQAEKEGFTVYMVTPDKDYAQLVSDHVFIYRPSKTGNGYEVLKKKEILENWEIDEVHQVIDMLGLQGDKVDNIPGIPGIGPKTAASLIKQYGSVENVIARAEDLKGKQRENVLQYADQAILSKDLATIKTDVPIQFDAGTYIIEPYDREALSDLFKELEFRSLADQILRSSQETTPPAHGIQQSLFDEFPMSPSAPTLSSHSVATKTIDTVPHEYHLAADEEAISRLIRALTDAPLFCLDTETTDVDPNQCELVGMSFALKAHEAYYVPVPGNREEAIALLEKFRPVFADEQKTIVGQNIKFDLLVLKWYGVELKGKLFDTMIAHYLLEPDMRHNMDYLAETYLKYRPIPIEALIGKKGKNQGNMADVPPEVIRDYAAEDADITLQLYEAFAPKLMEEGLNELYWSIEAPLIHVLAEMEYQGIRIDKDALKVYSGQLENTLNVLEQEIYKMAGMRFNIGSPKQVGELLFDIMKIPYTGPKTKTGQYSTDEERLSELAGQYPIAKKILEHRGLSKLKSTYVDALPTMINPKSGRVHSSFNQALASTGRLSSNNPNLQNIPIKTEEGREVRKAFVPEDSGHVLLAADYSQIELRLIAEMSGEEAMIEAFQKGQDIHTATAARIYHIPIEEVKSDQRRNAKTVNFSIIYGAGATNLSKQLGIKRQEAKELIEEYFRQYQGLKSYMEKVVEGAREKGFVETMLGRRRILRDINSRNSLARSGAERMAINTPVQGTAADMIKIAMIRIHQEMKKGGFQAKMVLQVHDELVFDVPEGEVDSLRRLIMTEMKNALPNLRVPILVETGIGQNWLEAH
jgi:DNA polymerase I